jgi:hypothetical protein
MARNFLSSDRNQPLLLPPDPHDWLPEDHLAWFVIKANRRLDRLKRRGRAAARSEWRLIAATHNLLKLYRSSLAPAGA